MIQTYQPLSTSTHEPVVLVTNEDDIQWAMTLESIGKTNALRLPHLHKLLGDKSITVKLKEKSFQNDVLMSLSCYFKEPTAFALQSPCSAEVMVHFSVLFPLFCLWSPSKKCSISPMHRQDHIHLNRLIFDRQEFLRIPVWLQAHLEQPLEPFSGPQK